MSKLLGRRRALFVALVLVSSRALQADSDPIAALVRAAMEKQHIPGLALLVARDGKVIRAEGYGFANLEHGVPVKPETIFQSGSVGKQFTATAVMQFVEAGKIRLDASITEYLRASPPSWKPVTVRQLLSHTAGFGDYDAATSCKSTSSTHWA